MSKDISFSLVPRPSLTAFFAAVAKSVVFATAAKKSCEGRPGYEAIFPSLQDPHYFAKAHAAMGEGDKYNMTTLRLLHYPPLPPDSQIKPGQLRCGEHVDYGSITLLFQDPSGGPQASVY